MYPKCDPDVIALIIVDFEVLKFLLPVGILESPGVLLRDYSITISLLEDCSFKARKKRSLWWREALTRRPLPQKPLYRFDAAVSRDDVT